MQSSHCGGFSYCGLDSGVPRASVVVVDWLSSCGSRLWSTGSMVFSGVLVTPGYVGSLILHQRSDQCPLLWLGDSLPQSYDTDPLLFFPIFPSIEEERICNIVLLLGVVQPDSVILMYLSILL